MYQFFPNNSVRVRPTNLKIDMLYHINYTFRSTVFSISVDVSLSSLPIITPNIFSSQLFGNFNLLNIISPFWLLLPRYMSWYYFAFKTIIFLWNQFSMILKPLPGDFLTACFVLLTSLTSPAHFKFFFAWKNK